jgi:hypothetical protein
VAFSTDFYGYAGLYAVASADSDCVYAVNMRPPLRARPLSLRRDRRSPKHCSA